MKIRLLLALLVALGVLAAPIATAQTTRTYTAYLGTYSSGATYSKGDMVRDSTGVAYISTAIGNHGNTPAASLSYWVPIGGALGGAGGDLAGTYPNPTVVNISGILPTGTFRLCPLGGASYCSILNVPTGSTSTNSLFDYDSTNQQVYVGNSGSGYNLSLRGNKLFIANGMPDLPSGSVMYVSSTFGPTSNNLEVSAATSAQLLAVIGTVGLAHGGTGQTTALTAFQALYETVATALGDLVYGGPSGAPTRLAGNTSTTPCVITEVGTGSAAQAPTCNPAPANQTLAVGAVTVPAATGTGTAITPGCYTSLSTLYITGVTTTTAVQYTPQGDVTSISGIGLVFFVPILTSGTVTTKLCTNSTTSVTLGSASNWTVSLSNKGLI